MTEALTTLVPLVLAWILQAPVTQAAAGAATPEDEIRAVVQQYYDAQSQRDADKAAAFWSVKANPRMSRDTFVAVFGEPAQDTFAVDVRRIDMKGAADARVRVAVTRLRVIARDGGPQTQRSAFVNSQLWRKEAAGWRLLRDGPFADEIADDLIAAAPSERAALYEQNRVDLVPARLAIAQRATMAITLGKNAQGKALYQLALDVARAANDRRGELSSL